MKRIISVSIIVIFTVIILLYTQAHHFVLEQTQENEAQQNSHSDIVAEDRNSQTENPEVNERIPDSAREMADEDDSCALSEEEKDILQAYAKYLQKFCEEYPYETDGIKFDLVFIDIDNIPELAIIPSAAHASSVILCVYNDGNVVETGGYGSFGKCRFNPYENLIFSTYMGQGEEESFFYRIEGTERVELLALHSTPQYEGHQYIGEYYEIDGTKVSEDVYQQVCEEWNWEELNIWGYDDAVFVNDVDDLYGELCKRFSFLKKQSRIEQDDSCLDVWQSDRLNVTYIERGNLICNSDGKMGYYYDNVYTIQDRKCCPCKAPV